MDFLEILKATPSVSLLLNGQDSGNQRAHEFPLPIQPSTSCYYYSTQGLESRYHAKATQESESSLIYLVHNE